jgi:hypothetical protein
MAEGYDGGFGSKELITWAILIWGFYRVTHPPQAPLGGCNYGPLTHTMQAPLWAQMVGSQMAIEGDQ